MGSVILCGRLKLVTGEVCRVGHVRVGPTEVRSVYEMADYFVIEIKEKVV